MKLNLETLIKKIDLEVEKDTADKFWTFNNDKKGEKYEK